MCPGNDRNGYYIGCLAIIADPQFGLLKPDQRDWSVEETLLSNTIKAINSSREQPDFVAFVGDLTHAEPFTIAKQLQIQDFMRCVSSLRTRPFFLCGNHDIGDQPTLDSLQAYRQTFGADYFVVDHFESKFIFLNSQLFFGYQDLENESLKQWLWLKEQCEMVYMYPYRHVVVLQHVPPFIETANEAPMRVRSSNMTFNLPVLEQRLRLLSEVGRVGGKHFFCGHLHRNNYGRDAGFDVIVTNTTTSARDSGYRLVYIYSNRIVHHYIPVPSYNLPT